MGQAVKKMERKKTKLSSLNINDLSLLKEFREVVLCIRIFPNMGDKMHPFTIHDEKN